MPDEVKPDPKQATTQDAQLAAEGMASGQEKAPTVDIEGDYEAAQQFSVSEVDRTAAGAKAAQAATEPELEVPKPEETKTPAKSTSDPDDYLDMASDLSSTPEDATNVSDDLVEKALEKGQPG